MVFNIVNMHEFIADKISSHISVLTKTIMEYINKEWILNETRNFPGPPDYRHSRGTI